MVDTEGFKKIDAAARITRNSVELNKWTQATLDWSDTQRVVLQKTYNVDFYNILTKRKSNYHSTQNASSLSRSIQAINIITFYFIRLHWNEIWIFNINIKIDIQNVTRFPLSEYYHLLSLYISFLYIIAGVVYPYLDQSEAFSLESIMNGPVRKALGIQVSHGSQSGDVFEYLTKDFMKPVIHIGINHVCRKIAAKAQG